MVNTQQVQGSSGCRDYHYTSWEQGRCEGGQGGQQDRQGNKKKRLAYFCRGETVKNTSVGRSRTRTHRSSTAELETERTNAVQVKNGAGQ